MLMLSLHELEYIGIKHKKGKIYFYFKLRGDIQKAQSNFSPYHFALDLIFFSIFIG